MEISEFRRQAHTLVDWMADYLEGVERYPVCAQVKPGEVSLRLPASPPAAAEPMAEIFEDFRRIVLPGITHWQHPSFFAYFPANSSPPSVLAEMLTATLGAQCMLWQTSPAASEMETRMLDWLRQMLDLPVGLRGVIQDSASSATLCALLAARERATGGRGNERGLASQAELVVYCSQEAHASVEKGAKIAGFGAEGLRAIPVDEAFALRPDALAMAIADDHVAGRRPAAVVATLGTTGVGANDPLREIGALCKRHGLYLHVDAAWAGSAYILPERRGPLDGVEMADSFAFNPHKWLLTNFDCTAHFLRDPDELVRTLSVMPAYLTSRETGQVIDYRDWSVPLGRRFRALKLWFVLRAYGVERLRAMLRDHIAWAEELAGQVAAAPDFELVTPARLSLFTFRYRPAGLTDKARLDALNQRLLEALNDSGKLYLTQTKVLGATVIRFQVGQTYTQRHHVQAAWSVIQDTARGLPAEG